MERKPTYGELIAAGVSPEEARRALVGDTRTGLFESDFERDVKKVIADLERAMEVEAKRIKGIEIEVTTYDVVEAAKDKLVNLIDKHFRKG